MKKLLIILTILTTIHNINADATLNNLTEVNGKIQDTEAHKELIEKFKEIEELIFVDNKFEDAQLKIKSIKVPKELSKEDGTKAVSDIMYLGFAIKNYKITQLYIKAANLYLKKTTEDNWKVFSTIKQEFASSLWVKLALGKRYKFHSPKALNAKNDFYYNTMQKIVKAAHDLREKRLKETPLEKYVRKRVDKMQIKDSGLRQITYENLLNYHNKTTATLMAKDRQLEEERILDAKIKEWGNEIKAQIDEWSDWLKTNNIFLTKDEIAARVKQFFDAGKPKAMKQKKEWQKKWEAGKEEWEEKWFNKFEKQQDEYEAKRKKRKEEALKKLAENTDESTKLNGAQ